VNVHEAWNISKGGLSSHEKRGDQNWESGILGAADSDMSVERGSPSDNNFIHLGSL